ncbi:MAG: hypothetical protein ACYC0B_10235 [Gemmatimonadaceae bacterium]
MTRRARRLAAPLALFAAAVLGCADLGTDPDVAAAVEFDSIPYPAVIAGDTLRDSTGAAAPLRAVALNGRGDVITGAPFLFVSLDTGVTIGAEGYLVATRRNGTVRLVASANGLQSPTRRIEVTRRPDEVAATGDTILTYGYQLPDVAANISPALAVVVTSDDVAGGVSPNVSGWVVRWRVVHAGDTLGAGDTALVAMLDQGPLRSRLDTTGTDGTSSRRLRVFANVLPAPVDSFIVVAEVKRHGVQLRGSPVRFVVHVEPAAP